MKLRLRKLERERLTPTSRPISSSERTWCLCRQCYAHTDPGNQRANVARSLPKIRFSLRHEPLYHRRRGRGQSSSTGHGPHQVFALFHWNRFQSFKLPAEFLKITVSPVWWLQLNNWKIVSTRWLSRSVCGTSDKSPATTTLRLRCRATGHGTRRMRPLLKSRLRGSSSWLFKSALLKLPSTWIWFIMFRWLDKELNLNLFGDVFVDQLWTFLDASISLLKFWKNYCALSGHLGDCKVIFSNFYLERSATGRASK